MGVIISANRFERRNNYSLEYRCSPRSIDPVDYFTRIYVTITFTNAIKRT